MVNYQLGKIYKIIDNTNGNIYVGSTCEPNLARRLATHLTDYKRRELKNNNVTSFQIFDNNDYNIVLLESYPCISKDELHARERFYIESLKCVNKRFPGRTPKEYREIHKEALTEYHIKYRNENKELIKQTNLKYRNENKEAMHEYYIKNKDAILEKSKIKVLCICGQYRNNNKKIHEKSKFHQSYLNNDKDDIQEKRKIVIECLCGGIYHQYSNFF